MTARRMDAVAEEVADIGEYLRDWRSARPFDLRVAADDLRDAATALEKRADAVDMERAARAVGGE